MNYEEIDKSVYGTDVFTNGARGRYAKPESASEASARTGEKKKRAPKVPSSITDEPTEQPSENGQTNEVVKTKKKSRKSHENGETQNEPEASQAAAAAPSTDGEGTTKPKKKRAPKVETNIENIDPIPTGEAEPVRKKKSKAPKSIPADDGYEIIDKSIINELEPSTETIPKVKKPKKHRTPKTTDTLDGTQMDNYGDYANSELNSVYTNEGAYGSSAGDMSYDNLPQYPMDAEPVPTEPEKSEYEIAIMDAYSNLASKVNFSQYVGDDQWCVKHLPKSARGEPKSRIRKMLPGGKDEKPDGKSAGARSTNQKSGFLNRIRSGVSTLVRDENNLLFGEHSKYELAYLEEEEDGVDTDDLHRYAQKLRELEDTDREVNPEFLVLRDGKTVYAVHEADAEGKMTLSTRKPIYDRYGDQAPDNEPAEKKKLLARLKNPFGRNKDKDKDGKGSNSPKPTAGETPDSNGKRKARKATGKTADDDMANSEPLVD